ACGLIAVAVLATLWTGARNDADQTSKKLASTRSALAVSTSNLAISKRATTAANASIARERDALASANHQLADAQQSASGLKNSVDLYKACGADLGQFFRALEANDRAGGSSALFSAKLDCDKIDPTIVPIAG